MERINYNQMQDPFFRRLARPAPVKGEVNNTPIRQRDTNKENVAAQYNREKEVIMHQEYAERESINPYINDSSANSRTVPTRKASVLGRFCVNHSELDAEFKIEIDGESLNYCGKCAAHLASNGFKVDKLLPSRSPRRLKELTNRSPITHKRRQELGYFIQSLKELEGGYFEKEEQISRIHQSHEIER
jgi:hypothetical protein